MMTQNDVKLGDKVQVKTGVAQTWHNGVVVRASEWMNSDGTVHKAFIVECATEGCRVRLIHVKGDNVPGMMRPNADPTDEEVLEGALVAKDVELETVRKECEDLKQAVLAIGAERDAAVYGRTTIDTTMNVVRDMLGCAFGDDVRIKIKDLQGQLAEARKQLNLVMADICNMLRVEPGGDPRDNLRQLMDQRDAALGVISNIHGMAERFRSK